MKYHAEKCTSLDLKTNKEIKFDSKLERRFYEEIIKKHYKKEIVDYEIHKKFTLIEKFDYQNKCIRAINYVSDFVIYTKDRVIVIDTKGLATPDALIKRKLMHYFYNDLEFYFISYSEMDGGWIEYDELKRKRRKRRKELRK